MSSNKNDRAVVKSLGGDGITKRVVQALADDDISHVLAPDFWQIVETQLAQCGNVLEEQGFSRNDFQTDGIKEPYQEVWYAAQVGWRCTEILNAYRIGQPLSEVMLLRILQIGSYATEWEWRLNFRPAILTGSKQRRNLASLRETQNKSAKATQDERRNLIAEMLPETCLTGGALDKWLKKKLKTLHDIEVAERTIRSDRKFLRS